MSYREGYIIRNPYEVGGRSTDISQIAYSIAHVTKEAFPLNGVPQKYVDAINRLTKILEVAESDLENVIEMLKEDGR